MKSVIAAVLFVGFSSLGFASTMATMVDGAYQGHGHWRDDRGNKGSYSVSTDVKSDKLSNAYIFGKQNRQYDFEVKSTGNGGFDVLVSGKKVGNGYCLTVQCHYSITAGDLQLEETLTFDQNHLYKIGSKQENGSRISWEEALEKKGN